jgi:hypothetical protein
MGVDMMIFSAGGGACFFNEGVEVLFFRVGCIMSAQHKCTATRSDIWGDAATAAIGSNEYCRAIKFLEEGRSVFWLQAMVHKSHTQILGYCFPMSIFDKYSQVFCYFSGKIHSKLILRSSMILNLG